MFRSFSISLRAEIISGFTVGLLPSILPCVFLLPEIGAKIVFQVRGANRLERKRELASLGFEHDIRPAYSRKPPAVRLCVVDHERRVDTHVFPDEALVVAGPDQGRV